MTAAVNFNANPTVGDAAGDVLAGRLASYASTGAFGDARSWSRWHATRYDGRVLEVGPGLGETTAALAHTGVDVSFLDASTYFAARAGVFASGAVGDVTALPYRDGAFAAVLVDRVLHHVPNLERALVELRRVVRPGGQLIVTLPNFAAQRSNAPAAAFAEFVAAASKPGPVTARPDAAQTLGTAPGWHVAETETFELSGFAEVDQYVRLHERVELLRSADRLDSGAAEALLQWAEDPGSAGWALELVGYVLT